jgi:hypothetical protein
MNFKSLSIAIDKDVLIQEVSGASVLLHMKTEHFYGLDGSARRMWDLITSSPNLEKAYLTLLDEFDVDPEQLRKDFQDFIAKLESTQLITRHQ